MILNNKEIGKMLILTRKINEKIIIDDAIVVQILGIKGNQVRLGITADKSISIHRLEISDRIKSQIQDENHQVNITYKKPKC